MTWSLKKGGKEAGGEEEKIEGGEKDEQGEENKEGFGGSHGYF